MMMLRLNSEKVLFLILSLDMVMQAKIISRVGSRTFSLKMEYPKIHPRYDWHDFHENHKGEFCNIRESQRYSRIHPKYGFRPYPI